MGYRDASHSSHFFADLVRDARRGNYVLPDFQRGFIWTETDVLTLLDSIYRGYPIGTLLLWENWRGNPRKIRSFLGAEDPKPYATLVLDGQQRIQAMIDATRPDSGYAFDIAGDRFVRCVPFDPPLVKNGLIPCSLLVDWMEFMKAFAAEYRAAHVDDPTPEPVQSVKRGKRGQPAPIRPAFTLAPRPVPTEAQIAVSEKIDKAEAVLSIFKDARIGSVIIPAEKDLAFCREVFRRMNLTGKAFTEEEVFACLGRE